MINFFFQQKQLFSKSYLHSPNVCPLLPLHVQRLRTPQLEYRVSRRSCAFQEPDSARWECGWNQQPTFRTWIWVESSGRTRPTMHTLSHSPGVPRGDRLEPPVAGKRQRVDLAVPIGVSSRKRPASSLGGGSFGLATQATMELAAFQSYPGTKSWMNLMLPHVPSHPALDSLLAYSTSTASIVSELTQRQC